MNRKEHEGWTNYETWAVALWLDNEEGSYQQIRDDARAIYTEVHAADLLTKTEAASVALADTIKQYHEDLAPELQGVFSDLLSAALSEVNWYEIAKHYIEEIKEESK